LTGKFSKPRKEGEAAAGCRCCCWKVEGAGRWGKDEGAACDLALEPWNSWTSWSKSKISKADLGM